ncbi:hypothetical protein DSO57_1036750 [Entomophthora muscae]|uniref:Uncharacterized protein n=1 Tax=Entomophthora muscae TaxID=34485 RepID=A0ACC2RDU9_9FUNG|nr:hypothetical protein DSO57_1036750 [Entomophthora muscae]
MPPHAIDLEFFLPHHLDLPPGQSRVPILSTMKEIPSTPPLANMPPAQDFSKLWFIYITVLGLTNQVMSHTGSWRPLATAVNYIRISPIVYMAFQAQPGSGMAVTTFVLLSYFYINYVLPLSTISWFDYHSSANVVLTSS